MSHRSVEKCQPRSGRQSQVRVKEGEEPGGAGGLTVVEVHLARVPFRPPRRRRVSRRVDPRPGADAASLWTGWHVGRNLKADLSVPNAGVVDGWCQNGSASFRGWDWDCMTRAKTFDAQKTAKSDGCKS
jgi:hypothetical protein